MPGADQRKPVTPKALEPRRASFPVANSMLSHGTTAKPATTLTGPLVWRQTAKRLDARQTSLSDLAAIKGYRTGDHEDGRSAAFRPVLWSDGIKLMGTDNDRLRNDPEVCIGENFRS
jgi:hypothetical protein